MKNLIIATFLALISTSAFANCADGNDGFNTGCISPKLWLGNFQAPHMSMNHVVKRIFNESDFYSENINLRISDLGKDRKSQKPVFKVHSFLNKPAFIYLNKVTIDNDTCEPKKIIFTDNRKGHKNDVFTVEKDSLSNKLQAHFTAQLVIAASEEEQESSEGLEYIYHKIQQDEKVANQIADCEEDQI